MKKFWLSLLVGLIAVVMAACGGDEGSEDGSASASGEKTITLKMADNHPDDYPTVVGDKEFARLVEEKTDGKYKIEVYSGGQLGDEKSVIEQLQVGSIDLSRVNVSPVSEFSDQIGVLGLPYLFEDEDHKWDILNGEIGEELLESLDDAKLVGLAYYDSGARNFYNSKRPVSKPADMKGLKIRVQQSDIFIELVKSLGASPTPMSYDEVYSGIQTGVLDGAENNFPSYYSSNHFEVAKYYTIDQHSNVPEVVLASASLWDKLDEDAKKAFKEAAMESQKVQREAWDKLTADSEKEILAAGNEITEIDDPAEWREAVQPLYDKHGEKYKEYLDKIKK
ncbi:MULTISPECIES: TRAP transporter substrate-binding protein [unclassified Sporosarcina]|uniref:TRAP transporter substrate-binding protein n=1 Tax=unclassified Sporosarcina TaxID=2647733 RepID=UPI00203F6924|nr:MULTISPECIES: TRAP transporter substrate-binding protein [unclassified Sporosarcina]GKV66564.1 C4-dicarboxylate ABC transporter [Sporosarcina sp. NCCP-2331]GLB56841.1 C4-dicarboxylate ABC transporter [Sporosarcina sp. NCCP-2378]